jgi:Arm DNA-binding domain
MKLSDTKLRTLAEPGRHFDGRGLYLEVTPAGGRYWRMKYRHAGKEKRLAFGVYPEVSLKHARGRCDEAHKAIERGEDPGELKKAAKAQAVHEARTTFEAVAEPGSTTCAASGRRKHCGASRPPSRWTCSR